MPATPKEPSRFSRWRRSILRLLALMSGLALLLVTWPLVAFYWNLDARHGPLQEMPLEGPAEVIAEFAGTWYQQRLIPRARVQGGEHPSLAFRMGNSCKLSRARVEGQGLVFDYSCSGGSGASGASGLRFVGPGSILWSEPGTPHSGCDSCTPTLTRASAWTRIGAWAVTLSELSLNLVKDGFKDALDACELWLVRNL